MDAVGPEWDVEDVLEVGLGVVDGTDLGVGIEEELVRPSLISVNFSTSVVSQHDESMGWSRFPFWATQT